MKWVHFKIIFKSMQQIDQELEWEAQANIFGNEELDPEKQIIRDYTWPDHGALPLDMYCRKEDIRKVHGLHDGRSKVYIDMDAEIHCYTVDMSATEFYQKLFSGAFDANKKEEV